MSMDKKVKKKIATLAVISGCLVGAYKYEHKYTPKISIESNDENKFVARYSNGYVYIGSYEYLKSINASPNDIKIYDERNSSDPNMRVFSSNEIKDKDIRNEILEIICLYEKYYPSNWDRTIETLRLEWFVHNFCYDFNYKRDHTTNVDLDNDDQEIYEKYKILNKILKL